MKQFTIFCSLQLVLFFSISTWAVTPEETKVVESLLELERRPTVQNVLDSFKEWPSTNVFAEMSQNMDVEHLSRKNGDVIEMGIKVAAKVE